MIPITSTFSRTYIPSTGRSAVAWDPTPATTCLTSWKMTVLTYMNMIPHKSAYSPSNWEHIMSIIMQQVGIIYLSTDIFFYKHLSTDIWVKQLPNLINWLGVKQGTKVLLKTTWATAKVYHVFFCIKTQHILILLKLIVNLHAREAPQHIAKCTSWELLHLSQIILYFLSPRGHSYN